MTGDGTLPPPSLRHRDETRRVRQLIEQADALRRAVGGDRHWTTHLFALLAFPVSVGVTAAACYAAHTWTDWPPMLAVIVTGALIGADVVNRRFGTWRKIVASHAYRWAMQRQQWLAGRHHVDQADAARFPWDGHELPDAPGDPRTYVQLVMVAIVAGLAEMFAALAIGWSITAALRDDDVRALLATAVALCAWGVVSVVVRHLDATWQIRAVVEVEDQCGRFDGASTPVSTGAHAAIPSAGTPAE